MNQKNISILFKKLLLLFLISTSCSYAASINAIALIVNDEPITLYDIEKRKVEKNISKEKAVGELVDEALYSQLINRYNITADIFDVNNYLEKIAASNGMDLFAFKSIIKQKYQDYDQYEEQTRKQILRQKLTDKIVRGNLKIADEEDLRIYYDNNISMFQMASNVKAVQYASVNKNDLETIIRNPMSNIETIAISEVNLDQSTLNSQLRYIINETNINQFTPIFTSDKKFVTLLIKQKEGQKTIDFIEVKDRVFNIVMQDREKKYLKDYFEKLKLSADIKILR